ncbi:MAG: hypothetical protein Q9191_007666, partial [Dirinaria sp. TL-2023a]
MAWPTCEIVAITLGTLMGGSIFAYALYVAAKQYQKPIHQEIGHLRAQLEDVRNEISRLPNQDYIDGFYDEYANAVEQLREQFTETSNEV